MEALGPVKLRDVEGAQQGDDCTAADVGIRRGWVNLKGGTWNEQVRLGSSQEDSRLSQVNPVVVGTAGWQPVGASVASPPGNEKTPSEVPSKTKAPSAMPTKRPSPKAEPLDGSKPPPKCNRYWIGFRELWRSCPR